MTEPNRHLQAAHEAIIDIVDGLESADLPRFVDRDGALWFDDMNMGWISASNPDALADRQVHLLFCAESAGRELARRLRENGTSS